MKYFLNSLIISFFCLSLNVFSCCDDSTYYVSFLDNVVFNKTSIYSSKWQEIISIIYQNNPEILTYPQFPYSNLTSLEAETQDFSNLLAEYKSQLTTDQANILLKKYLLLTTDLTQPIPSPNDFHPISKEKIQEFLLYQAGRRIIYNKKYQRYTIPQPWLDLLALPKLQRQYRTTWALYSIGNLQKKEQEAHQYFHLTRQAATQGFKDTLGLALISFKKDYQICYKNDPNSPACIYYLAYALAYRDKHKLYNFNSNNNNNNNCKYFNFLIEEGNHSRPYWTNDLTSYIKDPQFITLMEKNPSLLHIVMWLNTTSNQNIINQSSPLLPLIEKHPTTLDFYIYTLYQNHQYKDMFKYLKLQKETTLTTEWILADYQRQQNNLPQAKKHYQNWLKKYQQLKNQDLKKQFSSNNILGYLGRISLQQHHFLEAFDIFLSCSPDDAYFLAKNLLDLEDLKGYIDNCIIPQKLYLPEQQSTQQTNNDHFDFFNKINSYLRVINILIDRLIQANRFEETLTYKPIFTKEIPQISFFFPEELIKLMLLDKNSQLSAEDLALNKINIAIKLRQTSLSVFFNLYKFNDYHYCLLLNNFSNLSVVCPNHFIAIKYLQEAADLLPSKEDKALLYSLAGSFIKTSFPGKANRYYIHTVWLNSPIISQYTEKLRWFIHNQTFIEVINNCQSFDSWEKYLITRQKILQELSNNKGGTNE